MTPQIKQRIEQIRRGEVPEGYKKTKVGIVPNEWKETTVDKCVIEYVEKTTVENQYPVLTSARSGLMLQSEYYSNNQVTTNDNIGYNVLPRGYVTYRSRSDDGKFRFNENQIIDRGIISYFYPVFSFNSNVSHKFMLCLLNHTIYRQSYSFVEGTAQQVLSFKKLGSLKYCLPSLAEQEKIAEILSAQDRLIELKERLIEEKKRQKKALMQLLLTGKKRLAGFSGEWGKKSIGELCEILDSFRKPLNATERSGRAKIYPYYGANGIVDYVDEYLIDGSMILLAEDGGNFEDYCQKPIAYWVSGKCWVNNHAHILKPKSDFCNKFIFYSLQHKDIRLFINGTTRSKLTQEDLVSITITLPMDIEEQKRIAAIICVTDSEIDLLQKDLDQEKQKKKALMQLLLTGIVRV